MIDRCGPRVGGLRGRVRAPAARPAYLVTLIERNELDASSEPRLRDAIARVLRDSHVRYEREAWITDDDRIDFLVQYHGEQVGIEVKIRGSRSAVVRQLMRYAGSHVVDSLVLATSRTQLTQLPDTMRGKPVLPAICWRLP